MRTPAPPTSEACRDRTEPHHAATPTGTPSSDPARYALAALRTAVAQRARSRVDAAVGEMAARVRDPEHRESLDETQLDEVLELPPLVITARPPPGPERAAPAPAPANNDAAKLPGDEARIDDKAGDEDVASRLRSRLTELRAVLADGRDLRPPDTWLLAEAIAELLGVSVASGAGARAGGADAEVDTDASTPVDRTAQAGKQPDPHSAAAAHAGAGGKGSTPSPDEREARSLTKEMGRRNDANRRALLKAPTRAGQKKIPKEAPGSPLATPAAPGAKKGEGDKGDKDGKGRGPVTVEQATGGEAGGGGAVAAWKGKVDAKTAAIQAKQVEPVPDANRYVVSVQQAGNKQQPQSDQKKRELLASAKEAVKPIENYKTDDFNLPNDPLPEARQKVDEWVNKRIKQQDPPALVKSPLDSWPQLGTMLSGADEHGKTHVYKKVEAGRYAEIHVLGPGEKPPPLGQYDEVRQEKTVEDGKGSLGDRMKAHNAKEPRNLKAPARQRSIGDKDHLNDDLPLQAPTVPSLEGIAKIDPAKVLESALAGADKHTGSILARTVSSFPGGKGLPKGYINDWRPEIKADVVSEIDKIREAGKISSKTLKDKLQVERDKVEKEVQDATTRMNDVKQETGAGYQTVYEAVGDYIGGVRDDLDRQAEDQAAMAKGGYDSDQVKWLKSTRDKYIKANTDKVEIWLERYDQQRKSRTTRLNEFESEQTMAYRACAELDRRTIKARAPAGWEKDEAKKKEIDDKIQEITDWETDVIQGEPTRNSPGVAKTFKKLRETVDKDVDAWIANLKSTGEAYEKACATWYKDRLGIEQSIWSKILDAVMKFLGLAKKESKQWKRRSDADNSTYLSTGQNDLARLQLDFKKGLDQKQLDATKGLTDEQRAIAQSFFIDNKGDGAAALAAGLMARLGTQWAPRLHQRIEEKVLKDNWMVCIAVANEMGGKRVQQISNDLHASFEGPGTKKDKIYAALAGLNKIQIRAVEFDYELTFGWPLRAEMAEELYDLGEVLVGTTHDLQRGLALMDGARGVADLGSVNEAEMDAIAVQLDATMEATFLGTGAGTDEKELLKLLRGKSPAEIEAIKRAYQARYHRDLTAHIKGELLDGVSAPYQWEEALALLEGRSEDAEAAALRGSMGHVKVGGERAYFFLGATGAALGLDDDKLINKFTREPGEAEEALDRVRKQVDDDAKKYGWNDATYRRQLAIRLGKIDDSFGTKYAGGVGALDVKKSPLEQAFGNAFGSDSAKMLTGILRQDLAMESAGRVGAEIMPVPGRTSGVNKALFDQYQRQYEAERRDEEFKQRETMEKERLSCTVFERDKDGKIVKDEYGRDKIDRKATDEKLRGWRIRWVSPEGRADRQEEADEAAEKRAKVKAPANMAKLTAFYEDPANGFTSSIWSKGSFEQDVFAATNVSWAGIKQLVGYEDRSVETDKTLMLLHQGGYLSGGQQLFYAVYGVGTDTDAVDKAYEGKSKKQIDKMHADLRAHMTLVGIDEKEKPAEWVKDDFSGRALDDIDEKQYGVPRTPADKVARAERQLAREKKSKEGGSGVGGMLANVIGTTLLGPVAGPIVGAGLSEGLGQFRAGLATVEMQRFEQEVTELKSQVRQLEDKKKELAAKGIVEGDAEYYEALAPHYERIEVMSKSVDSALEAHRAKIDAIADWVVAGIQAIMIVGAVVIGAVVSAVLEVGTAGGATPAVAAIWTAVITALVTTAATIAARAAIKGGAYGWEEFAGDVATGVVEAILAAATANISTALIEGGGALAKLAAKGPVAKFIAEGLAGTIEGVVQAIPSSLFGAALNEHFDPMEFLGAIGQSAGMAAGMHAAKPLLNPVLGRLGNALQTRIGPRPTAEILSYRGNPAKMEETFHQFQKERPGATRQQFLKELDTAMLARHKTAFAAPETQQVLRGELLDGLPAPQRQRFAGARVELVSDAEFGRAFGNTADSARVVMRDGKPVVVARAGTELSTLGARSPHLFGEAPTGPRPRGASLEGDPLAPGAKKPEVDTPGGPARRPPPRVVLEPMVGPVLDSPIDIARKQPGTHVVAGEATNLPPTSQVRRLEAVGGAFHPDNMPAHLPINSVDEVKLRFPLPHDDAARAQFMKHLNQVQKELPHLPPARQAELAMARVESLTAHAPYSLQRLKPGGELEVVFWEGRIAGEVHDLQKLRFLDPTTGKVYKFEIVSTGTAPKSQIAPHSGWMVPIGPHDPVNVARLRKVEVTSKLPTGAHGPDVPGGVVKGEHSGRPFVPDRAGGPVRDLDFKKIKISDLGVDAVDRHIRRFDGGGEMELAMVERLRRIARGEIAATPEDKAFYSHELRESVRYRKEGWRTGQPVDPDAQRALWNDVHTATLEDYKLRERSKEGKSTLFHPEVEAAAAAAAARRGPTGARGPEPEVPAARSMRDRDLPLGSRAEAAAQAEKGRCAAWVWVEVMRNAGWVGAVADQPGWHPSVDVKPARGQPKRDFGSIVRTIRDPATGATLPRVKGTPSDLMAAAQGMAPGTQIILSAKTRNEVWHAMLGVVQPDGSLQLMHVNRAAVVKQAPPEFGAPGRPVHPNERVRAGLVPDPAGDVLVTTRIYHAQSPELASFHDHRWWVLPPIPGPGHLPRTQVEPPSTTKPPATGDRLPARVRRSIEADLASIGHPTKALAGLDDNALLAVHARAQAELAPRRIAEYRETLGWKAKGELDSLVGDTHLHHEPISPSTQYRLEQALATPVALNPTLRPGEIQVKYKVGALGNVTGLEIHLGPGATLGDALLHVGTLHAFKRYQGVTGVLRNVTDSVARLFGGGKPVPFGSRAHEAWQELQKLPALVESRRIRLADQRLDVFTRVKLEIEIENLEGQLARHINDLASIKQPARGHVAGVPWDDFPPGTSTRDILALHDRTARRFLAEEVPFASSRAGKEALARMRADAEALGVVRPRPEGPGAASTFRPSRPLDDLVLARYAKTRESQPAIDVHYGRVLGHGEVTVTQQTSGGRFARGLPWGGASYDEIIQALRHHPPDLIARALADLQLAHPVHPRFAGDEMALGELRHLMFGTEVTRDPRNLVFSALAHDILFTGRPDLHGRLRPVSLEDVLKLHPAVPDLASVGLRHTHEVARGREISPRFLANEQARLIGRFRQRPELAHLSPTELEDVVARAVAEAGTINARRQVDLLRAWYQVRTPGATLPELESDLERWLRSYYARK